MSTISFKDLPKKYMPDSTKFTLGTPVAGGFYPEIQKDRYRCTQLFGENAVGFYKDMGMRGHNGIDYQTDRWQDGHAPAYAAHDGWVISDKSIQSDTMGRFVNIMTDEVEINGLKCKVRTIYFHLSEATVSMNLKGASTWWGKYFAKHQGWVNMGQPIGLCGNSGQYTTGAHLHFGMYIYWKRANGNYSLNYDNGYHGAVDPMPYFNDYQVHESHPDYYFNGVKLPSYNRAMEFIKKHNH